MHIKNARTTLTVDASQRLRPWTMPVHFNELRYPWNANDAKINLTNLHSHLRKKSPSPLNTAGCTRRKTNKKKLAYSRFLSLLPRRDTFAHTLSTRDYDYYYNYKNANLLHDTIHKRPDDGGKPSHFHWRNKARFGELSQRQSILACAFDMVHYAGAARTPLPRRQGKKRRSPSVKAHLNRKNFK